MKYRDKVRNKPTKQSSNRGGYNQEHELTHICPNCNKLYPKYDSDRACSCKTALQKILEKKK